MVSVSWRTLAASCWATCHTESGSPEHLPDHPARHGDQHGRLGRIDRGGPGSLVHHRQLADRRSRLDEAQRQLVALGESRKTLRRPLRTRRNVSLGSPSMKMTCPRPTRWT